MKNNYINFKDDLIERLQDPEYQKEFLNVSLEEYIEDGDFKSFFKSLEYVIKARGSVTEFAQKVNLNRRNLYELFKGEQKPQLDTVIKILKELGYSLKVAYKKDLLKEVFFIILNSLFCLGLSNLNRHD